MSTQQEAQGAAVPALSKLKIQVSRGGRTGNRFIISGSDAAAMHQILSDNYAEPGDLRRNQFVFSAKAHHELNPPVIDAIDELNKRAGSKGREIQ
jgi:hypothetical protein